MSQIYMTSSAAFSHANLSKSGFKVMAFLSVSANRQTKSSFKSKKTIAAGCGLSESTVARAIRELCHAGLLAIKARFRENGRQTSNLYTLIENPQLQMEPDSKASDNTPKQNTAKNVLFPCKQGVFASLRGIELKIHSYITMRTGKAGSAYLRKKEIAAACGVSISTVFRAIRSLKNGGYLSVARQTRRDICGNNGCTVNCYTVLQGSEKHEPGKERERAGLFSRIKAVLLALLAYMTPSPVSWVTPQGTRSITKVTVSLRKKKVSTKLTKRKNRKFAQRNAGGCSVPAFSKPDCRFIV